MIASTIKNGVVTTNKLANEVVTDGQARQRLGRPLAKLGDEVAPLLGTLKSGQTLRGTFDLGGDSGSRAGDRGASASSSRC